MKKLVVSGLSALALAAVVLAPETHASAKERVAIKLGTDVPMQCTNPGSSQDVSKTPIIKNTTGATIRAGKVVSWATNGTDKGTITLAADLTPGATVLGHGGAGNGYTCTASISSLPDLIPSNVQWQGTTAVKVEVRNMDAWIAAEPSVVRLQVMSCSGAVLQTYDSAPVDVPKNEVRSMTFPATFVPGKAYLRVTADANRNVLERNEANNVYDGSGSCIH